MKVIRTQTDPDFGEFFGRNGWTKLAAIEARLPDDFNDVQMTDTL